MRKIRFDDTQIKELFGLKERAKEVLAERDMKLKLVESISYSELEKIINYFRLVSNSSVLPDLHDTGHDYHDFFNTIPHVVSEPVIASSLDAIYSWWERSIEGYLKRHNQSLYKMDSVPQWGTNYHALDPDAKHLWIQLLIQAMLFRIGRVNDSQNRGFMALCEQRGWLDAAVSVKPDDAIRFITDDMLHYIENSLSDFVTYYHWLQIIPSLFVFIKYMPEYYHAFLVFRDHGLPLQDAASPGLSPFFQGGLMAPPMRSLLGKGTCFLAREMLRSRANPGQDGCNGCYVPTTRILQLLARIGITIENGNSIEQSQRIHSALSKYLGQDKAHFMHSFDIPLQILSLDDALAQRILGSL